MKVAQYVVTVYTISNLNRQWVICQSGLRLAQDLFVQSFGLCWPDDQMGQLQCS